LSYTSTFFQLKRETPKKSTTKKGLKGIFLHLFTLSFPSFSFKLNIKRYFFLFQA